jgi:hypothetical protein
MELEKINTIHPAWTGNREEIARLSGLFRSLTKREQDQFLVENGLQFARPASESNVMEISPARQNAMSSPRLQYKTREALQLVEVDNTIIDRVPGKPLPNVSGVRFTDDEFREWFDKLEDTPNCGYVLKSVFLAHYSQVENFGCPVSQRWLTRELAKLKSLGEDRLSFHEFAYMVSHVAKM